LQPRSPNAPESLAEALTQAVSAFGRAMAAANLAEDRKMQGVAAALYGLGVALALAERGLTPAEIRSIVSPARELLRASPFISRIQSWPRGYQGDFETIEMLVDGVPAVAPDHPAYWIDWYALNTALAQQHRNKLDFQGAAVGEGIESGDRILALGAGGARDLAALRWPLGPQLCFDLVDIDPAALELARARLAWAHELRCFQTDALRHLRGRGIAYRRIVAGGLFDYLPDRAVVLLLRLAARRLLPERGRIVFTNLAPGNPYRPWIEHLADWRMHYRDRESLTALAAAAGLADWRLKIETDATGLALLGTLDPPGG